MRSCAFVLLLSFTTSLLAAAPKVHTVSLGAVRRVPYPQPDAKPEDKSDETSTIKVRSLIVDDRQRDWTTGEAHDITDRTFAIRRALHINDALPTDSAPHWIWQPGPWITVDRVTGHITALHLPYFDPVVSNAIWFRDYAAYCGTANTSKGGSLHVIVASLARAAPSSRSPSANGHSPTTSFLSASPQSGSGFLSASPSSPQAANPQPTTSLELFHRRGGR